MIVTLYTPTAVRALDEMFRPGVPRAVREAVSETLDRIEAGEADDTPPGPHRVRMTRVEIEAPELWVYWSLDEAPRIVLDLGPPPATPGGATGPT